MAESFMLVSLKGEKAKKLAQVMSNPTCTKLLDHLAKKGGGSETEIAKELDLPLSTVHYNLKQLVASKLVVADEYHYSKKGREILHYKLANKYIIIAPEEEQEGFVEKLKHFLPIAVITLGAAFILKLLNIINGTSVTQETILSADRTEEAMTIPRTVTKTMPSLFETAKARVAEVAPMLADSVSNAGVASGVPK